MLQHGLPYLKIVRSDLLRRTKEHEYASLRLMQGSMNLTRCLDPAAFARASYSSVAELAVMSDSKNFKGGTGYYLNETAQPGVGIGYHLLDRIHTSVPVNLDATIDGKSADGGVIERPP